MNFLKNPSKYIILIIFALLQGCTKISNTTSEPTPSIKGNKLLFPNNEGNPFDFVGKYHNAMLDTIISDYFYTNNAMDSIIFFNKIKKSIINNSNSVWDNLGCQFVFSMEMPTISIAIIDNVNNNDIESTLSEEQLGYYNEIKSIIHENIEKTPNDVFDKMEILESTIMESGIQNEQLVNLLIAASIAKYSFAYWYKQYKLGSNSLWMQIYNSKDKEPDGWFSSMGRIVDADIESGLGGALLGGTLGAMGGSVVPGAGTITGGIAGVVVGGCEGAVVGSAVRGFFELFG